MKNMRLAALAIALGITVSAHQGATDPRETAGRRFALLVGVTEFISPAMKKHNLQGPANDVALFRSLLTSGNFRVPADAIVSLAGLPVDEAARPTRSNIEREFRRLREKARTGDHVVVLLAGHGSQQPADPDPADEEPDGLDEIFLAADATGWDRSSSRVANAIVDDEIRQWIGAIRNTGAVVWLIVDACHAGTMSRAAGSLLRERSIPAETLIPVEALASAREKVDARSIGAGESRQIFDVATGGADIAALYAADTIETTPELPMPERNGSVHGLFTYTLTRILSEHAHPMTYRELVQRVIDRYRADGFGPTPAFEGAGVDREVLGERPANDRSPFLLGAQAGSNRWILHAGSIHGVTRGSILELSPPRDDATHGERLGHVRVVEVHPTHSAVEPIAFAKVRAPSAARILAGTRARIRHYEFGALRIRVAMPAMLQRVVGSLESLSQGLAERVTSGASADWSVRVTEANRVVLAPSRAGERHTGSAMGWGKQYDVSALDDPDLPNLLADRLRRIARVTNLGRLSSYVDPEARLQVRVARYRGPAAPVEPLVAASGGPIVKAGQQLQFVVTNSGTVPLDVTVLYIDANFGIWPLFPKANRELDNLVEPGRDRALDAVEVTADPTGWESIVAIGVESTPRHENFRLLAQESLTDARGTLDGPSSPLRALLESAMYGTRAPRVHPEDDRGRFAISQTWFRVVP